MTRATAAKTPADVDIVTPVYGSPEFLRELLRTMLEHEAGVRWSWTLVDDCGPDREKVDSVFAEIKDPRVHVIKNNKNSGFAMSNNFGFSRGSSPLLLMLNSDIVIMQDNWLREMTNEFTEGADSVYTGVVGAKLLFFEEAMVNYAKSEIRPPGRVQHAGVGFNVLGQAYHIFQGWKPDNPRVNVRREMNAVTGACLMTRRDVYQKIGGLDRQYTTGNFEDVQYALQVRALGGKVIYTPKTTLYHFAGGSGNSATAKYNASLFQMKCKDLIEYDDWRYL